MKEKIGQSPDSKFTNAAKYLQLPAMAISVIDPDLQEIASDSVRTSSPTEADEAAIALVIVSTSSEQKHVRVITDSQAACRRYAKGRVSSIARRILTSKAPEHLPKATII